MNPMLISGLFGQMFGGNKATSSGGGGGGAGLLDKAGDAIFFRAEPVKDSVSTMENRGNNTALIIIALLVVAAIMGGTLFIYSKKI